MRLLLLQDHIYLPSYGGGVKANRMLLEALGRRGHECAAITPSFAPSAGPTNEVEFREEMERRGLAVRERDPGVFSYRFRGVDVDALHAPTPQRLRGHVERRTREFQPDWVLVNDDKARVLLDAALAAAGPERVVLLLQTITNTPFGPLAVAPDRRQTQRMREVRAIVAISAFLQRYLAGHGRLQSTVLRLPIYGDGPFLAAAGPGRRYVTMVNPCREKGVDVFLPLARELPDVEFAAVRGWGTDPSLLRVLEEEPNIHVFEPADDLDEVLASTRVLLAPSLWPETFGYIVPEAMLRGIPVLASDAGGLREAALGAATLLPVALLERRNGHYVGRRQRIGPWKTALQRLLTDPDDYGRRASEAHEAALAFVSTAGADRFESFLTTLAER
jgi:glycosyltransferase involved in cell wall biosynthesis